METILALLIMPVGIIFAALAIGMRQAERNAEMVDNTPLAVARRALASGELSREDYERLMGHWHLS